MVSSVTIGICTSNDVNTIDRLLNQIFRIAIKFSKKKEHVQINEIIVVSSGSTDGTNEILRSYDKKIDFDNFKLILEEQRNGKSHAVNQILQDFQSKFLILLPADVFVTFKSINSLINKIIGNKKIGVVSGHPIPDISLVNQKQLKYSLQFIWKLHNKTLEYTSANKSNNHSSGELMILRKGVVTKLSSDIINDDAYIGILTKEKGYDVLYEPKAKVLIDVPKTVQDYLIQRKRILSGHSQIQDRINLNASNFRMLLKSKPLYALKILSHSINSYQDLIGFLFSILFEIRIELQLFIYQNFQNKNEAKTKFKKPTWTRINNYQQFTD